MNCGAYIDRGYAPVPIPRGSKAPTFQDWTRRAFRAEEFWENCNIGLKLGAPSGGLVDVDLDALEAVEAAHLILPATNMVSGRPGKPRSHWWFKCDQPPAKASTKFADMDGATLVELRSTGGQTLVPPSTHPNGEPLAWSEFGEPARLPADVLRDRVAELAALTLLVRHWPARGQRHDATLALCGGLLRGGWTVDRTDTFLSTLTTMVRDEEFRSREANLRTTADRIARGEAATGWPKFGEIAGVGVTERVCEWLGMGSHRRAAEPFQAHDCPFRLANVFLAEHYEGGNLRCWQNAFYAWDGKRYRELIDSDIRNPLRLTIRREFEQHAARANAHAHRNYEAARAAFDAARAQGVQGGREPRQPAMRPAPVVTDGITNATVSAIRSLTDTPSHVVMPSYIGQPDARFVGMDNGLLNLDTWELQPHSPKWFSTVCLPYAYDPAAQCPKWLSHLDKVLAGDHDKIQLLQSWLGYCLTSNTSQQKFLVMIGEGRNGKSAVTAGKIAVLGEENVSHVAMEDFGERFALGTTLGKLANFANEIGDPARVAERQLKQYVSGDPMQFDRKNREPISARPTAKLVFCTNNMPRFRDRSEGMWRRLIVIPFEVRIDEGETVLGMDTPEFWLRAGEVPGIFNWAIEGYKRVKRDGLTVPLSCQRAAAEHKADCNPAADFLESHCVADEAAWIACRELYGLYRAWCADHGYMPLGGQQFGQEVHRKFGKVKASRREGSDRVKMYRGVRLAADTTVTPLAPVKEGQVVPGLPA